MRTILLAIFLFSTWFSFTQDFKKVDSIVKEYPKTFESIISFADKINSDFDSDIEKTRAAYYWISNNISYDYKDKESVAKRKYNKESFANDLYNIDKYKYAEKSLSSNKAICAGYSLVLKHTLDELNIKCEVINGYAKTDISDVGWKTNETNHAWNAVYLNDKWQLIDATWSTGNEEGKPSYFNFDDSFFLIKPRDLIWSHFPKDKKWQLLDKPVSTSAFFYAPIIHTGYYNSGLELTRMQGLIKPKENIQIAFDTINQKNQYYYQFSEDSLNLEPITFVKEGEMYIAQIPYNKTKGKKLVIFSDYKACLSFKII